MIKPLNCCVLVKPEEVKNKTSGGLYLPDSSVDREQFATTRGTVVAIAHDAFIDVDTGSTSDFAPKVGDKVFFGKYAAKKIEQDGETLWILKDVDVTAVVHDE